MKIMIIRHGDPDYVNDNLTERGKKEAALLAQWLKDKRIDAFYVSPLGRAQATAKFTLDAMGRTAETLPWLQEFPAGVRAWESETLQKACPCPWDTTFGSTRIAWDILPSYLTEHEEYYHKDAWRSSEIADHSDMSEVYDSVIRGLDELLKKHGYARERGYYRAERANDDTIAFFCHFGLECILLSHLMGISPFALWHGFIATPSSVTILNTEEREEGIAIFRAQCFGDTSHLALGGMEPAFSGRYCERFTDDTLH